MEIYASTAALNRLFQELVDTNRLLKKGFCWLDLGDQVSSSHVFGETEVRFGAPADDSERDLQGS